MLGFGPPRYSLKLGPRQAAWAVRSRDWRGRPHLWSAVVDLPSVLLRPSPVEPNISDVDALKSCLHALIGIQVGRQAPCWPSALVLTDLCVRTVLLHVDTLLARSSERDALIRWRLEKEASFPVASARVVSQVVGPHSVLVAMMGESVMRQYETVCDDLGLVLVSVTATSLLLHNFARASFPGEEPTGWVSILDEGFTFMVHQAGRPVFVRTKTQSPQIQDDLVTSLAFYEETHPGTALRRLYLLNEEREADAIMAISKEQDRQIQLRAQTEGVDLSDPAMGQLTAQVVFANDLIAKRAFSWTRFLSDLEETVPSRVSINNIRLDFKGAIIAIGGSALSLKDLTTFIISLEDHRAFKDATLLQHRVRDNDIVEFSLTVRYLSQALGS